MTGMLASVNSLEEALQVHSLGVDIIDLKQPSQGALGALTIEQVTEIVETLDKTQIISATVGDLPMQADIVFNAVKAMAATGVDYVKIGIFPTGDIQQTIENLAVLSQQGITLIAVLFADAQPDFNWLNALQSAGFRGVMLDTMDKGNGGLTEVMPMSQIKRFVKLAKELDLLCGLAGSLRKTDVDLLLDLDADYLGFRGALCQQHNRIAQLDKQAVSGIKQAIKSPLSVYT